MVEKLKNYGLENVRMEKFTHPGWIRGSSSLTVTEPKKPTSPALLSPWAVKERSRLT
jgi:hypothetical protein